MYITLPGIVILCTAPAMVFLCLPRCVVRCPMYIPSSSVVWIATASCGKVLGSCQDRICRGRIIVVLADSVLGRVIISVSRHARAHLLVGSTARFAVSAFPFPLCYCSLTVLRSMKRSMSIVPPESRTGAVVVALRRVVCPPSRTARTRGTSNSYRAYTLMHC